MANGAFGQVRLAKDNVTDEDLAVKLENSNAKMPMLFLEYRFYKVMTKCPIKYKVFLVYYL